MHLNLIQINKFQLPKYKVTWPQFKNTLQSVHCEMLYVLCCLLPVTTKPCYCVCLPILYLGLFFLISVFCFVLVLLFNDRLIIDLDLDFASYFGSVCCNAIKNAIYLQLHPLSLFLHANSV